MKMKQIFIENDYITLVKLLKFEGIISQGGDFYPFIEDNNVTLNDVKIIEKGKKIYLDSKLCINDECYIIKKNED